MRKILLYSLMLLSTFTVFSCSDDDTIDASSDRLMRPQFRTRYTVSSGTSAIDLCQVKNINQIFLAWSKVDGATSYEIKMSTENKANNAEKWEMPENMLLDTIIAATEDTLTIRNLSYSTSYRFAIRAISSRGEAHNSEWWGYGDGQHWSDYLGLQTDARYATPSIVYQKSELTKSGVKMYLNRLVDTSNDDYSEWIDHFKTTTDQYGNTVWKSDFLLLEASQSNPNAKVPEQYKQMRLDDSMFDEKGLATVLFEGLDSNSVYNVNVMDSSIPVAVDAVYNPMSFRTKGTPGDPILIKAAPQDTMMIDGQVIDMQIKATLLTDIINNFMTDNAYAEGQVFELEGGQTYFFRGNQDLYKGFTLRTKPEDIAAGKGRAKVCLGGVAMNGADTRVACFMLGRNPVSGENANIAIDIESIVFDNIDIDCPLAQNNLQNSVSGNYFVNQYSGGMGINIQNFEVRNCTIQNMIRGFFRTQCKFGETIDNFIIEGCEFYNCGGYGGNGSGYGFVTGDMNNVNSNIFRNMVWRNNTFFDTPIGNFITHGTKTGQWKDPSLVFKITVENNTFVNWNTYSGRQMFSMRSIPAGSTFIIRNNLFVQTKASGDGRDLNLQGADIRTLDGACEGLTTFDIYNNWSTNDNITESTGDVFTSAGFSAVKNSFGAWLKSPDVVSYPHGEEELKVHVANISAADLMYQPNPPHKQVGEQAWDTHRTDGIDGTGSASANLYFKNFTNDIVTNAVGASKWRTQK